ncbi:protein-export chaperone SecB [Micromonospora saelicesensis]|uniref:protein-export chaperone SecB n=1 Tax=Micromonospora saelicesensis TaxID=285676 RepID=UPI000DDA0D2B|nr:protein-export chaperone SecB [Micromonospora saelicesensis]
MTLDPAPDKRGLSDRVAQLASLVDLRMRDIRAELVNFAGDPPFIPSVSIEPNVGRVNKYAVYDFRYSLSATDAGDETVFRARLVMNLVFALSDPDAISKEALEAFGAIGVVEIAHPYMREIVHNLTLRMGLPPFVLEVAPPLVEREPR